MSQDSEFVIVWFKILARGDPFSRKWIYLNILFI